MKPFLAFFGGVAFAFIFSTMIKSPIGFLIALALYILYLIISFFNRFK